MRNYIEDCIEALRLDDALAVSSKSGRTIKVICCDGKFGFDVDLKSKQILYTFQRGALNFQETKEVSVLLSLAGDRIR